MRFNKFIYVVLMVSALLMGCKEKYTHDYLMQHPELIQSELSHCQRAMEYSAYCDSVKQTEMEFDALINVQREDQEAFGKQLLQAEIEMMAAKDALKSDTKEHRVATESERKYLALQQKVNVLLAVIGKTSSPE